MPSDLNCRSAVLSGEKPQTSTTRGLRYPLLLDWPQSCALRQPALFHGSNAVACMPVRVGNLHPQTRQLWITAP
jgi:hypothetical protein